MEKINLSKSLLKLFGLIRLEKKEITALCLLSILSGLIQLSLPLGIQAIINFAIVATGKNQLPASMWVLNIMNLQSQAWAEQIEEQSKLSNFLWDDKQQPYELNESILPDSSWLTIDLNKIAVPSLLQVIEEASLTHPKIKLVELKTNNY